MGGIRLPAEEHPGLLGTQELEAARKDCRGSTALPTPRFQASGLQNYEGIHICCFRPRSLCSLLRQPQETNTGAPTTLQRKLKPTAQARRSRPRPDFTSQPFLHDGLPSWKMPSSCCLGAIAFAVPLADMLFPIPGMFGFFSILRASRPQERPFQTMPPKAQLPGDSAFISFTAWPWSMSK